MSALVEVDENELNKVDKIQFELTEKINDVLRVDSDDSQLGWQGSSYDILDEQKMNVGKCAVCECWVSDREKPEYILELNIGATYNGELLCDEHLPKDHRWAF